MYDRVQKSFHFSYNFLVNHPLSFTSYAIGTLEKPAEYNTE